MFLCCKPPRCLIRLPRYDQVLTGVLPYVGNKKANVINNIRRAKQPGRPTDPSQNKWMQDHIWDTITTCWNKEPAYRCELSVLHHVFSMPSFQDVLVESPPVGRKNLSRLVDELLYTLLILPLGPGQRATLRAVQRYMSDVISRDGASLTILSSAEAKSLAEKFCKVSFPH